LARALIA